MKYIGHIIEKGGVRPGKDNLRAIREFERPKNKINVRQLIGKLNFYYKYVEDGYKLLEPLHYLLRKNVEFSWTEKCGKSIQKIKKYFCPSSILSIYNQNKELFIYTNASGDRFRSCFEATPKERNIIAYCLLLKKVETDRIEEESDSSRMSCY